MTVTSDGTYTIHGRSDSTINRGGVRMGSADIYAAIEELPEIADSLVIGTEPPDGGYYMPLFVVLKPGAELSADLVTRIRKAIGRQVSPRHVPDEITAAPAVPRTLTGKKLEGRLNACSRAWRRGRQWTPLPSTGRPCWTGTSSSHCGRARGGSDDHAELRAADRSGPGCAVE